MTKSRYNDDFVDGEEVTYEEYFNQLSTVDKNREARAKRHDKFTTTVNEVGVRPKPTPEILEKRAFYKANFKAALHDLFPESTGLKPFGDVQNQSTDYIQYIMDNGGRLVLLEPRGYAKTTRITNITLLSALEGLQEYIVIVASSLGKSQEILEDIRTELTTNEKIEALYPATCAAFKHLSRSPHKTRRQTYDGEFTYIDNKQDSIHFPVIPGEPSSGVIIQVRPATNLKGLKQKIAAGPRKGRAVRPTLYFFDDPQTEEDAVSPTMCLKIIRNIKRSALKGGTHQKPVDAIMAITPVSYGDVAWHFVHQEDSFDLVRYKMLESEPERMDLWLGEYKEIRSNFDKEVKGSRTRAYKQARQYVKENFDVLHAGSHATWEHAFVSGPPLFEISAVQHAINIIIDDGIEDFEYECQCNTEYGIADQVGELTCPIETIASRVNTFPKRKVAQQSNRIVTHIDVNKDILSYVTISCPPNEYRPAIIDYGTWPDQPGKWSKRKMTVALRTMYPQVHDYREIIYLGLTDLINHLATMTYPREDGVLLKNSKIGIDIRYEETYTTRAVRESPFASILLPTWGTSIGPDDDLIHEKKWPEGCQVFENCVITPNRSNTFDLLRVDVNFFKTEVHKAFNYPHVGLQGSLTMFEGNHRIIGEHCNAEYPDRVPGKKSIRTKVMWKAKMAQPDNEYFDNITNALAILVTEGTTIETSSKPTTPEIEQEERSGGVLSNLMKQSPATLW